MKFAGIIFFLLSCCVTQAKVIPLPDLLKPNQICVDNNNLYVADGQSVSIFSLDDFHLIRKFGKKGGGPKEFDGVIIANCQTDQLIVKSFSKLSHYKKNGDFISEIRKPQLVVGDIFPIGKNYIGSKVSFENDRSIYNIIYLWDSKMQKIKEICREKKKGTFGVFYDTTFEFKTNEKNVFVVASKNFKIDIYNESGSKIDTISREYKLEPFTKEQKALLFDSFKRHPATKEFYQKLKKIAILPDFFPAIRKFTVADGKIYVQTFRTVNEKSEFFIFDDSGKFIETVFLAGVCPKFFDSTEYVINKRKLYYLKDNEATETWEIHITDI